ncbi:MAG: chloride channel protein, partial [Streptococcus sp.]|nr:chloride channel protein [Streptococcus sp.]
MVLKSLRANESFNLRLFILTILVGVVSFLGAELLVATINLIANLFFNGRFTTEEFFPARGAPSLVLLIVPLFGSFVLGLKARFIDDRIRGHGIPEVIDSFVNKGAWIPARLLFLRPLASAVSIGTGGPYGAEGPVIGLGSAAGSAVGQIFKLDIKERRLLLCCGAAGGISAIFGTPIAAIFLVMEIFIRKHSLESLIPIGTASLVAYLFRCIFVGADPMFMAEIHLHFSWESIVLLLLTSIVLGFTAGLLICFVSYLEKCYEKTRIHWMWWPVLGIMPLAVFACFFGGERLLGPSYDMIEELIRSQSISHSLALFCILKGIFWAIAVSSRTTGGTLAPLLLTGGGIGAAVSLVFERYFSLPL